MKAALRRFGPRPSDGVCRSCLEPLAAIRLRRGWTLCGRPRCVRKAERLKKRRQRAQHLPPGLLLRAAEFEAEALRLRELAAAILRGEHVDVARVPEEDLPVAPPVVEKAPPAPRPPRPKPPEEPVEPVDPLEMAALDRAVKDVARRYGIPIPEEERPS